MADNKRAMSSVEAVDEYFDMLIKSRFIEMFEGHSYPSIRLGDLLKQNTAITKIDCPEKEVFVTLSSKGRGARKREIKDGKTPVAFSGYRIHAGQFIYSRIDARNAAFDIVPDCLDGAVVSKDFPVFDIEVDSIEPVFLLHSVLQDSFVEQIQSSSFGATNRQRVKEETMMDYTIVLPPLSKQKNYCNFVQLTNIVKSHYHELVELLDALVKSRFIEMFGNCENKVEIGRVCSLHARIGWQALTKAEHMDTGDYILITGTDFVGGRIDWSGCRYVSKERFEMDPNIIVQNGDILVTKDGTIGKVAVVENLPKPATLNAGIFVVRNKEDNFTTEYLQQCLLSSDFQRFIDSVKRGATIIHLNQNKFLKYTIPLADLHLQEEFVNFVQQVDKSKFTGHRSLSIA